MDIFFAPRPERISNREGLACGWCQPVSARGRTETGGCCGREGFLRDEFARAEWPVGHAEYGSQTPEAPGGEGCSYFTIAPGPVGPDCARAFFPPQKAYRAAYPL